MKELAVKLKLPEKIVWAIKRHDWGVVKKYAQQQWNKDGYALMKRYDNAVNRVVSKFDELKGGRGLTRINADQRKEIARYCHTLGVGFLVKDMENMINERPQIKSLNYFLQGTDSKVCRWERIRLEKLAEEYEKEKAERNGLEKAVGKVLFGDGCFGKEGGIASAITPRNDEKAGIPIYRDNDSNIPEWLEKDEARLAELEKMDNSRMSVAERGEKALLKMRLGKIKSGKWKVK
jgi:hypothetical protein